jgi:hypothetical protein
MILCSVADCGGAVHCRGWCEMHYHRWRRHGDPMVCKGRGPDKEPRARSVKVDTRAALRIHSALSRNCNHSFGVERQSEFLGVMPK